MSCRSLRGVLVYGNSLSVLFLVGSCGVVHAQGVGLGANGAPTAADYNMAAYGFAGILAPLLRTLLPWCLGALAVWSSPYIVEKLLYKFRDGAGFREQFKGDVQHYVSETKKSYKAELAAESAKKERAARRASSAEGRAWERLDHEDRIRDQREIARGSRHSR